jgi:hypothetical protein
VLDRAVRRPFLDFPDNFTLESVFKPLAQGRVNKSVRALGQCGLAIAKY